MAEQIPTGYKAVREDFEHNANQLEQLATGALLISLLSRVFCVNTRSTAQVFRALVRSGLLEQSALSSEEQSVLQLVRGVRLLGDRTSLQLAQEARALKFVASPVTQVLVKLFRKTDVTKRSDNDPQFIRYACTTTHVLLVCVCTDVPRDCVVWEHRFHAASLSADSAGHIVPAPSVRA